MRTLTQYLYSEYFGILCGSCSTGPHRHIPLESSNDRVVTTILVQPDMNKEKTQRGCVFSGPFTTGRFLGKILTYNSTLIFLSIVLRFHWYSCISGLWRRLSSTDTRRFTVHDPSTGYTDGCRLYVEGSFSLIFSLFRSFL